MERKVLNIVSTQNFIDPPENDLKAKKMIVSLVDKLWSPMQVSLLESIACEPVHLLVLVVISNCSN